MPCTDNFSDTKRMWKAAEWEQLDPDFAKEHCTVQKRKSRGLAKTFKWSQWFEQSLLTTMEYSKNTFHLAVLFISQSSLNLMKIFQSLVVIDAIVFCVARYNLITWIFILLSVTFMMLISGRVILNSCWYFSRISLYTECSYIYN